MLSANLQAFHTLLRNFRNNEVPSSVMLIGHNERVWPSGTKELSADEKERELEIGEKFRRLGYELHSSLVTVGWFWLMRLFFGLPPKQHIREVSDLLVYRGNLLLTDTFDDREFINTITKTKKLLRIKF